VLKRSVSEELLLAIRAAHRGDVYLSPSISHSGLTDTLERTEPEWASLSARLTSREREVLQLITEGYTNAAVADLLQIGVRTVERHRANLMAKLGAHDLSSLLSMAIQHRLIVFDM
jgi:DNA-binding NarL/FixJ family response regulator